MTPLLVSYLGRTQYADAWQLQQEVWDLRQSKALQDILLLTEHEPVYTLGKSADDNHLLASSEELKTSGTDVFHIDRGGDITYTARASSSVIPSSTSIITVQIFTSIYGIWKNSLSGRLQRSASLRNAKKA